jgi:hypothetical protein
MTFDASKLIKKLATGQGSILVPHIDAYQQRGIFPETWTIEIRNNKAPDEHFHPSSDALQDPIKLYREKKGLDPIWRPSALLRRTYDCGHMWHGYLQNILVDMGFVRPENVERYVVKTVHTKRGLCTCAGTGDLVDVQIPGHGSWLVDIKTMTKETFGQGLDAYMLAKYTAQVNLYMDWFDQDQAMILAVSKDSPHEMKEIIIPKNQALIDEIYDKWCFVSQCLRAGIEPKENEWIKTAL